MDTPREIAQGLYHIIVEPDFLITDYIVIGGIGAAFVNAGLLMLITLFLLYLLKEDIQGITVAAIYLMGGFGLFGKNIFNIWLILIGVILFSLIQKERINKNIYIAFFGTSLAPILSEIYFGLNISLPAKILLGFIVGISIGLLLPPLSAHLSFIHKGYNLYNVGFAAGILGTIIVSLFRSYGFISYSQLIWSKGNNLLFSIFFGLQFLSMILIGFFLDARRLSGVRRIFSYSGVAGSNYIESESFGSSLMNMGLNGLLAMGYILIINGDLNGPTLGGILTIMSFGACGKHLKNIIPLFVGVALGSLTKIWYINDPHIQLAALFGTGLAPIAGHYGWFYGIIAGFINSSVVLNSGILHGGMNLYNTGFSAGITAAVMIPVLEIIKKRNKKTDLVP
jgi:hypothetical protein